ncbi:hypothetical protein FT663_03675 [Candidozyma haemuli var. vulneris]|uniref:Uncharacterized protein n=1 Tax=Candidozyma haemuli TaxID=45357 RepID=A0A2V1AT59_9ASCO|nr:hypothetical protein CXQ85_004458 [[Candida] haemuloni]KAF3987780.1 hypothetical protein FT662_03798 [[Candida] haemuloni var. vulneris]KAF3989253.1 hypothetical protein FT663_03675 [[Candida] haemuloni var. vulneris]PVH20942.1 hypothetical protein CXQ85_004458 [[Candida] haemuloni]
MFLPLIILAIVFCAISLYLPYSAGLTHLERRKREKKEKDTQTSNEFQGYVPPDEEMRRQREEDEKRGLKARASALKEKLHVTAEDMPVSIRLNQESGLRKRGEKVSADHNPNNYDYDLDELIQDEAREANAANIKAAYAGQQLGGDKESMV